MELKTVYAGSMDVNTYLITTEKSAIIIDPGVMTQEIKVFINQNKDKEFSILLTHNHFDHILGANEIRSLCDGKIYINEYDATGLLDGDINLSHRFCLPFEPFEADVVFNDEETIRLADVEVKTMLTPGHSKGSTCFFIEDWMFSGDTLFRMSVGRTDFINGDRNEQIASLKKIASISRDYEVYPGHGPATRLSFEKQYNPYIKEIL